MGAILSSIKKRKFVVKGKIFYRLSEISRFKKLIFLFTKKNARMSVRPRGRRGRKGANGLSRSVR